MAEKFLEHDWFPKPLPENVEIGERSWLYSAFAFVHYQSRRSRGVKVGHDTGLYAGTFFDLGPEGEVEIGNFCALVGAIICTNGRVAIGDYAFISHEVVIADTWIAQPCLKNATLVSEKRKILNSGIEIGENSWIGAGAILLAGAKIGKNSIIGAQSLVDFEVPDSAIVAGNPAKIRGYI